MELEFALQEELKSRRTAAVGADVGKYASLGQLSDLESMDLHSKTPCIDPATANRQQRQGKVCNADAASVQAASFLGGHRRDGVIQIHRRDGVSQIRGSNGEKSQAVGAALEEVQSNLPTQVTRGDASTASAIDVQRMRQLEEALRQLKFSAEAELTMKHDQVAQLEAALQVSQATAERYRQECDKSRQIIATLQVLHVIH